MLKQRIITAIILIAATLAVLFYLSPQSFCIVIGVIALAAAWEWTNLMEIKSASWRLLYLVVMFLVFLNALFIPMTLIFVTTFIWWLFAIILITLYPRGSRWWGKGFVWRGLMGLIVLMPCWAAVNYIRNQNQGIYALIFLFVLVWGADSTAYFVGKKWGKNKLASIVSPGKSIEGVIGAVVFAIVITLLALWSSHVSFRGWPWAILLSVVTVLFSVVGDLFESMLKRQANLKDSSQLLPGHGGILDRIDSLTAAAPIFAFGALLLGMYL